MRTFLPSDKCYLILRSYPIGCKRFCKSSGQSFVIIEFSTDVFTNNISSTVLAMRKFVCVTRLQICTIVGSIYIRYWCFGNICNKKVVCSNCFRWRLPKTLRPLVIVCQHKNEEIYRGNYFYLKFSKKIIALCLPKISKRYNKFEDISATTHTPQLLASNCFFS